MISNNTLLTISTVALVFTGAAEAANSNNLHNLQASTVQQQLKDSKTMGFIPDKCAPGVPPPECRPNDDYMCIAA